MIYYSEVSELEREREGHMAKIRTYEMRPTRQS